MDGEMMMPTFKNLYLLKKCGNKLHIDYCYSSADKPNLIFCCTPICSVVEFRRCYVPFVELGFNVFAIDFTGVGKSEGDMKDFSVDNIIDDFEIIIEYIQSLNDKPVFVFGDTGIGGIIAQYFVASTRKISGFAQFGNAIYRDIPNFKYHRWLIKILYAVINLVSKLFPKLYIPFPIPKYSGYNEVKDNSFYTTHLKRNPKIFHVSINLIKSLMYMLWDKKSYLKENISVPTLVFKTLYDRYFPPDYFDRYYQNLLCTKKMIEIEDVHNSYFFYPDLFAKEVAFWFMEQT